MSSEKPAVLKSVIGLVASLQKSLHKVRQKTVENAGNVAALTERHDTLTTSVGALCDDLVQLKSGQQTLFNRIKEVEFENNKREEAQTARDQSNVQSLVNLRDSAKKAFDQVASDVKRLLEGVQRVNERTGQVESQNLSLVSMVSLLQNRVNDVQNVQVASSALPSGHVWVNKKLSGVYAVADEFEARLQKLEAGLPAISVAEQNNIISCNRARVISAEGLCTDSLCKQLSPVTHYFGPGCRFYETGY